jgi:hypothetical protein
MRVIAKILCQYCPQITHHIRELFGVELYCCAEDVRMQNLAFVTIPIVKYTYSNI